MSYCLQRYRQQLYAGLWMDVLGTVAIAAGIGFVIAGHNVAPTYSDDASAHYSVSHNGMGEAIMAFLFLTTGSAVLITGLVLTGVAGSRYKKLSRVASEERTIAKHHGLQFSGVATVTSPYSRAPVGASLRFSF